MELFSDTGVKEVFFPITQPTGYGMVSTARSSSFTNFPSRVNVLAAAGYEMFVQAVGERKRQKDEILDPFFWIDFIMFMPRELISYIGINEDTIGTRALRVILTAIWWFASIAFALYLPQIKELIIKYLQ